MAERDMKGGQTTFSTPWMPFRRGVMASTSATASEMVVFIFQFPAIIGSRANVATSLCPHPGRLRVRGHAVDLWAPSQAPTKNSAERIFIPARGPQGPWMGQDGTSPSMRLVPVISSGLGMSSNSRIVGAMSYRAPPSLSSTFFGLLADQDEGHRVSGVCRLHLARLRIDHLLGVAVVRRDHRHPSPLRTIASAILPMQLSTVSIALTAAGMTPVWPTMSPLAKLTMITGSSPLSMVRRTMSHTSGALISGCRS